MKQYFLVPNFDEFPEDGPLFLGSIIANPKLPQHSLNEECRILPETEKVITGTGLTDYKITIKKGENGEYSFWAKLVEIITAGFVAQYATSEEDQFHFDQMETKWFIPSDGYVKSALSKREVRNYLKNMTSASAQPLYMVIGLKIVQGATITQTIRKNKGRDGNLASDNTQISLGLRGQGSSSHEETRTLHTSERHIIGFRIRRVEISPDRSITQDDFTTGACFGVNDAEESEENWVVKGLGVEDCGNDVGPNLEKVLVLEEEEGHCFCIY